MYVAIIYSHWQLVSERELKDSQPVTPKCMTGVVLKPTLELDKDIGMISE